MRQDLCVCACTVWPLHMFVTWLVHMCETCIEHTCVKRHGSISMYELYAWGNEGACVGKWECVHEEMRVCAWGTEQERLRERERERMWERKSERKRVKDRNRGGGREKTKREVPGGEGGTARERGKRESEREGRTQLDRHWNPSLSHPYTYIPPSYTHTHTLTHMHTQMLIHTDTHRHARTHAHMLACTHAHICLYRANVAF